MCTCDTQYDTSNTVHIKEVELAVSVASYHLLMCTFKITQALAVEYLSL